MQDRLDSFSFTGRHNPKPSRFYSFGVIAFMVFAVQCAPLKKEVTEMDMARVMDYMASRRISTALSVEEGKKPDSDWEIFQNACKVFRLDSDLALQELEKRNSELFQAIQESR